MLPSVIGLNWLLSINYHQSLIHLGAACGVILSLAAEVTCISVFPGFWMNFPMILAQELLMTSTVAYINLPSV